METILLRGRHSQKSGMIWRHPPFACYFLRYPVMNVITMQTTAAREHSKFLPGNHICLLFFFRLSLCVWILKSDSRTAVS